MWVRIPHLPQKLKEMAKKRMFELLDEMNQEDGVNGTQLVEVGISFVKAKLVKARAEITMGMPESCLHDIVAENKIPLLIMVDKKEYFKRQEG